ncbi:exported hypothetical protein [metagenome]|uniref:Uncharacterized protein n=1 Tax=metagenome TaxID=256318 RepID=A0A2P2C5R1_9ZZZZ
MTNLHIVNILLGLSIVCMAVSVYAGLPNSFILAILCTVFAGANRHYEIAKR